MWLLKLPLHGHEPTVMVSFRDGGIKAASLTRISGEDSMITMSSSVCV